MKSDKIVTVYCSSYDVEKRYREAVREFAHAACRHRYRVLCGGSIKGLMGELIDTMLENGGEVVGVIPEFMKEIEIEHKGLNELIITDTMSKRKELLRENSRIILAFPGGLGTLDELLESFVLTRLGKMEAEIILYSNNGFWDPFISLLDHLVTTGMLDSSYKEQLHIVTTVDQLTEIIDNTYTNGVNRQILSHSKEK